MDRWGIASTRGRRNDSSRDHRKKAKKEIDRMTPLGINAALFYWNCRSFRVSTTAAEWGHRRCGVSFGIGPQQYTRE